MHCVASDNQANPFSQTPSSMRLEVAKYKKFANFSKTLFNFASFIIQLIARYLLVEQL